MSQNHDHAYGEEQFQAGNYEEALFAFSRALLKEENTQFWNDWSTACWASGRIDLAEQGYRQALRLEPASVQSAANLGVLLSALGRFAEAVPMLAQSAEQLEGEQQAAVSQLLGFCKAELANAVRGIAQAPAPAAGRQHRRINKVRTRRAKR